MSTDTIAAIGTALSNSGISIIRISGKDSLNIIRKIFVSNSKIMPNNIIYGKIVENGKVVDTVLVSYFKNPKSYTGEDVCEINCHGGVQITREILQLVLANGARLAEPGEFSKRAFLNGKMDLTKAEAVINLINSKNTTQARIAANNLEGDLYKKINRQRRRSRCTPAGSCAPRPGRCRSASIPPCVGRAAPDCRGGRGRGSASPPARPCRTGSPACRCCPTPCAGPRTCPRPTSPDTRPRPPRSARPCGPTGR